MAQDLRAAGANLWVDQLDIVAGQNWDEAVEAALHACDGMLVILSPESVASKNVRDEVSYALEEKKLVVPVLLARCEVPFRLRRLQRADFTGSYEEGVAELKKGLGIARPAEPAARVQTDVIHAEERRSGSQTRTVDRTKPAIRAEDRRRSAAIGLLLGAGCSALLLALVFVATREYRAMWLYMPSLFLFNTIVIGVGAAAGAAAGAIAGNRRVPAVLSGSFAIALLVTGLIYFSSVARFELLVILAAEPSALGRVAEDQPNQVLAFLAVFFGHSIGALVGALAGTAWEGMGGPRQIERQRAN